MKIETLDKLPPTIKRRGSQPSELSKQILDLPIDKVLKVSGFDDLKSLSNQRQSFYSGVRALKFRLRDAGFQLHTNIDKKDLVLYVSKSRINSKE